MIGEPRGGASHSLGEWVLCEHRGDALLPRHRAPPGRCSKVMPPLTPAHLSCRFQLTYHPGLYPLYSLLSALCSLLSALCSLLSALCSLLSALCSLLSALYVCTPA